MFRFFCIPIGYLIGCIQTAYILGKLTKKIDIRDYGSGNAGTTNTIRVMGRWAGYLVFVCDVLKAILAFLLCTALFGNLGDYGAYLLGDRSMAYTVLPGFYAGIGAVLGHNFPFYMRFKGGKGVATSLGMMLFIDWRVALVIYITGILIIYMSKYVSLGALVMFFLFPALLTFTHLNIEWSALALFMCVLGFFMHRGNIKRLLNHTERRIGERKDIDVKNR